MEGRTSTRSSAARDQASSPPNKTVRERRNQTMRSSHTTRSTRSGSQDTSDSEVPPRRSTRSRGGREGSAESAESLSSIDSSRLRKAKGKHKATLAIASTVGDLSIVAEDQEMEEAEDDVEMVEDNETSQREILPESPGALSNMSGTTALTSHSQLEMADLDSGIMVETLPDLFLTSIQILQLLAPPGLSLEIIIRNAKELQIPGSNLGKRLNLKEKAYDGYKTAYGSELFINPSYVSRKLFEDKVPPPTAPKYNDILQEANIAMLIKTFIVAQRDSPDTTPLLQRLDDVFPDPFLTNYEDKPQNGGSALIEETFDLALDIRTQTIISALKATIPDYYPEDLLADVFFDPHQRTSSSSSIDDFWQNRQLRTVAGISTDLFSDEQVNYYSARIRRRVENIRGAFVVEPEAIRGGERIDFDFLHQEYSWTEFLLKIAKWGQSRTTETRQNIENQGGIQILAKNLSNIIQSLDSTAQFNLMQPPAFETMQPQLSKRTLQPPARIIPASAGKSFYQPVKSILHATNSLPSSSLPPSNQEQQGAVSRMIQKISSRVPMTPRDKISVPREPATAPAKITEQMHMAPLNRRFDPEFKPIEDFDNEPQRTQDRSTQELVGAFRESENYKNKENRPVTEKHDMNPSKRRFIDRQENAQRITWTDNEESQPAKALTPPQKRSHQIFAEKPSVDDQEDDDDDAYQQDDRIVDLSRRQQAPVPLEPARKLIPSTQPSPIVERIQTNAEREEVLRGYNMQEGLVQVERSPEDEDQDAALQASARNAAEGEDEEMDNEEGPPATLGEVKQQSRLISRLKKASNARQPRRRQRWSEDEENLLIRLIGRYGNQWSVIITQGNLKDKRDQVALKDKARNLKVDYLKTGSVLPLNFDLVALGKKERDKVKAYGRNPWRKESEEPGYETLDMDGNKFEDELE